MTKINLPQGGKNEPDRRPRHIRLVHQEFEKGHTLYINLAAKHAHFSGSRSKISFTLALEAAEELREAYQTQIHVVGKKGRAAITRQPKPGASSQRRSG